MHTSRGVADSDRMFNRREERDHNPAVKIKKLKLDNPNNPILAHLNINSICYKHADLFTLIDSNIDVLVIGETKRDSSFPNSQFEVDGHKSPFRKDRNSNGGGLLMYVRDDIPSWEVSDHLPLPDNIEIITTELNFKKQKWLFIGIYRSQSVNKTFFLDNFSRVIELYSNKYKNVIIAGDFNMEPNDTDMQYFLDNLELYNLIKGKTCFKSTQ